MKKTIFNIGRRNWNIKDADGNIVKLSQGRSRDLDADIADKFLKRYPLDFTDATSQSANNSTEELEAANLEIEELKKKLAEKEPAKEVKAGKK